MAKRVKRAPNELDSISKDVADRFKEVPWNLFDSKDLGASGETRFMVSRIQQDLMEVADKDPVRAGRIWDEHVPSFVTRPDGLPPSEKQQGHGNSIAPGRTRRRRTPAEAYLDQPAQAKQDKAETASAPASELPALSRNGMAAQPDAKETLPAEPPREDPNSERLKSLLQGLEKQYLRADDRYHFRDRGQEVAFEARDKKLVTQFETPSVIESMIDLAETRGWSSLKLDGSQAFRREAWLQASLRDVEVTGYKPTKLDKARLKEMQTARASQPAVNTMSRHEERTANRLAFADLSPDGAPEARLPLTAPQAQFVAVMEATMRARGDSNAAIAKARDLATDKLTSERVHVGKLVDIGSGPYQDRKDAQESAYITLENDRGQRSKVWGVDLPRALEASGAKQGQFVAIAFEGRKPVEVDVPIRDGAGTVVRTERQAVERNTWQIVQVDKLRETAKEALLKRAAQQDRPPELRVYDRSARPQARPDMTGPQRQRGRERTL